jgi:hypothetical protein
VLTPLADDRLTRPERIGLYALLATVLVFGAITEMRAAFLETRKGDQEIYFWSAYAVRAGDNPYQVVDTHDWHYVYPPLFAILMVPFAEKPPEHPVDLWTLPFPVSVALWYGVSVLFLVLAVHWLAGALEEAAPSLGGERYGRRWWALRVWPILACLPSIGHTLARGQVNLLILLFLAGMTCAFLKGRSFRAGLWLAPAICIKVIPAFLLIYPLWRRDLRCLAGCALGLVTGLLLIPLAVFGPERTWSYNVDFVNKVMLPGVGSGDDHTLDAELTRINATPSQSFIAVIHNTVHPPWGPPQFEVDPPVRAAHWLISAALTGLILFAAGWRRPLSGPATLIFLGCLFLIMILTSPVCHAHYFCLTVPLVMGVLAALWERQPGVELTLGWTMLFQLLLLTHALTQFPAMENARDIGLGLYPALAVLVAALVVLYQQSRRQVEVSLLVEDLPRQAA